MRQSSENESALAGERRQIHGEGMWMERGERKEGDDRKKSLQKCGIEERTQVCLGTHCTTNCKTLGCSLQPPRSQFLCL